MLKTACKGKGNIRIARVNAESVDPRYPILLAGLDGSNIENVQLGDIKVTYRGGLTMEHATEQRQLNTNWEYTQYQTNVRPFKAFLGL